MSLFQPSRDQARQFLFDVWAKFKQSQALSDLEKIAIEVINMHPEYHVILDSPERHIEQQYFPEMGETNPFLHLNLHLSILEQINIDQPNGIKHSYQQLLRQYHDSHLAQHDLLECLAETIWQSQRNQLPLDSAYYLSLIQEKTKDAT